MPSYIAESYLSRTRGDEVPSLAKRARDAARTLAQQGEAVAYLRSAFVPEDEVCLHWFIAPSSTLITELGRLAELDWDRVVEELEPSAKEQPCATESA